MVAGEVVGSAVEMFAVEMSGLLLLRTCHSIFYCVFNDPIIMIQEQQSSHYTPRVAHKVLPPLLQVGSIPLT